MDPMRSTRRWVAGTALFMAIALGAAACGGSSTATTEKVGSTTDVTVASTGTPTAGGSVVFGLEAESDGFNPTANRWAASGYMVADAVFDPIAAFDAEGNVQPYLAQSFTPSADFRTWRITMRSGISFTNGQPLDGAAVAKDLNAVRADALTGAALANLTSVEVDPSDPMTVILVAADPWASLPSTLSGQIGFIAAPAQLDASKPASSNQPIGTGPFIQKEWVPDNHWSGTRNPNYWRTDARGTKLPYLDSLEFRPVVDPQSRVSALLSGDLDMMVVSEWGSIERLRSESESGHAQIVYDRGESEEAMLLINTSKAPLDDVRVRRALALCTDIDPVLAASETPAAYVADSQFAKDSPYYVDTNFPRNDVAAGTALIDEVKAQTGGPVTVTLTTNPVPTYLAITSLLAEQWGRCGVTVQQQSEEQSKFVADAVTGKLQVALWRQFGGDDPDVNYVWWTGRNATGLLALNAARLKDPQIDAALDRARASADIEVRKQAYAELQRRQTELIPYIWLSHSQWAIGAGTKVRNIGSITLPGGAAARPFGGGVFRLTEVWIAR